MSCVSTEGTFRKHLFTVRADSGVVHRSPVCLRCGAPRKPPPPPEQRNRPKRRT